MCANACWIPLIATEIPIENHRDRLFRLSVQPDAVFFDDVLFSCTVPKADFESLKTKTLMTMQREEIATAFGIVSEETQTLGISLQVALDLKKAQQRELIADTDSAKQLFDRCRKALEEACKKQGSKNMLRQDKGVLKLCWEYEII